MNLQDSRTHSRVVFKTSNRSINRQVASRMTANMPSKRCLLVDPLRLRVIEVARVTPIGLCNLVGC